MARANFQIDAADLTLKGHAERVGKLKSSAFHYVRGEAQRKLTDGYAALRQQLEDSQKRVSSLGQRALAAKEREAAILQVYLLQREHYRNRVRQGLTDASIVITELRQLSSFPLELLRTGIVTSENVGRVKQNADGSITLPTGEILLANGKPKVAPTEIDSADIARLKQETKELRRDVDGLHQAQVAAKPEETSQAEKVSLISGDGQNVSSLPVTDIGQGNDPRSATIDHKTAERKATAAAPSPASQNKGNAASDSESRARSFVADQPNGNDGGVRQFAEPVRSVVLAPEGSTIKSTRTDGESKKVNSLTRNLDSQMLAKTGEVRDSTKPKSETALSQAAQANPVRSDLPAGKNDKGLQIAPMLAIAGASTLALVGLAVIAMVRWSQRKFEVVIGKVAPDRSVTTTTLELRAKNERIVLGDGNARVEPSDLAAEFPAAITVTLLGRAKIIAGTSRVVIGDAPIEHAASPLPVGESFEIQFGSGKGTPGSQTYVLRDLGPSAAADSSLEINEAAEIKS